MFNHAQFIWGAADILRGTYKQHQYGDVILPFTVLSRLDAVLAPTKEVVLAAVGSLEPDAEPPAAMLRNRAGHRYSFFNRARHDLKSLQGEPDNLEQNLRDYVNAFSANVRDIFEELIRRFAEASNETAGEHFTPRDVIELMVTVLTHEEQDLRTPEVIREVYDPTAGTGGMLSVADDKITELNPTAQVNLLGQGINPASYAICKADLVVKGQPIENIKVGNALTDHQFEGRTFHYCLSNPPFGVDWKQFRRQVETRWRRSTGSPGSPAASVPGCRASPTVRCCSSCT